MKNAKVIIRGTKPFLNHYFGPDSFEEVEREGKPGNDPGEWRRTVRTMKNTHQIFVDPSYVFGAIRNGAKSIKASRSTMEAVVASTLEIVNNLVLIDRYLPGDPKDRATVLPQDPTEPVYLDVRTVVNPMTKGKNVRYRVAASPGWRIEFTIQWDELIASTETIRMAIAKAGQLHGIGDGRKIGMGRFVVESFEVRDGDATEALAAG